MKRAASMAFVVLLIAIIGPPTAHAAAAPGGPIPIKVVLIGDSYSAGNGAGSYFGPADCYRSHANWAQRYATYLRDHGYAVTFINRACSGAVIANLTTRRLMDTRTVIALVAPGSTPTDAGVKAALRARCISYPDEEIAELKDVAVFIDPATHATGATASCARYLPPQVDAIGKDTDLVLFTAGGNDVNFADIVKQCFAVGPRDPGDCRDRVTTANTKLPAVQTGLVNLFANLRGRLRPDARVAMLTYPYLSDRKNWTLRSIRAIVGFGGDSYDAGKAVRDLGDEGDRKQRDAVTAANHTAGANFVTLIDGVKSVFAGHEPDPEARNRNPDRWIHEFDSLIQAEWYHPNDKGHEAEKNLLVPHGDFGSAPGSPTGAGSIDLVFSIDTTGSMQPTLDQVKALTSQMVDLLVAKTASYRFALVTYRDQPAYTGGGSDYAARIDLPFTTDVGAIHTALSAMDADGGGDFPESVYSGVNEALGLPWRPGVKKVVIQIGDAPPHDPEPVSNLTAADIIAHALAVDPAQVYPVDVSGGGALGSNMTAIANDTGGAVINADSADVGAALLATITGALAKPYAWAGGPYVAATGTPVALDGSGSFDTDGTITRYEWDFDGNGSYDQSTTGPLLSHTWTDPIQGSLGLRVTDNDGNTTVATAHLAITKDGDEVADDVDNCPAAANSDQEDADADGVGDVCDPTPLLPSVDSDGVFPADDPGSLASSAIAGTVILDTDGDGAQGTAEHGLPNVALTLTGTDAGGIAVSATTTTDPAGAWNFGGLLPGTYQVSETQPSGLASTIDTVGVVHSGAAGASPGQPRTDSFAGIILSGVGSTAVGYRFGERVGPPAATPVVVAHPLPTTGVKWGWFVVVGATLVLAGAVLLVLSRRRRGRILT